MSKIQIKKFFELTVDELHDILQLRSTIFVVEQNCVFLDADGHDKEAIHLMAYENEMLIGCVRVLPPGRLAESSVGRLVVHQQWRNKNVGKILMQEAIKVAKKLFPEQSIMVQAQAYLKRFYEDIGFHIIKGPYDYDGIPHHDMLLK